MALKDRIDVMNGLTNVAANVTNLLNAEAPGYIRYIPDDLVRQFTTASTDNGTDGVTLGSGRFVYAHKDGRRAQLRDSAEKAALTDANSLHLATALTPACYVENGKAYVKPSGGTVVAVLATTLNSSSDDSISFLPAPLGDAVQVKVAWRLLAYSIFGNTAPYDKPVSPTIEYIPAGFSAMSTAALANITRYSDWNTTTLGANSTAITADDVEIATAQLQRGQQQLESLQLDLSALIEKYRLDAQQETNVDLQNQSQKAQTELQNFSLSIQRYQTQVTAGLQMLQALIAQHDMIMSNYVQPQKAIQKVYKFQPVEAEA